MKKDVEKIWANIEGEKFKLEVGWTQPNFQSYVKINNAMWCWIQTKYFDQNINQVLGLILN